MACSAGAEREGFLNQLLAPGPLMLGHQHLEGTRCLECHDAGKGLVDDKCLKCHTEIKKFVDGKKGFHGMAKQSCVSCHSDHKGRELDSTKVDQKSFDHKITGFDLDGKHAEIKCQECHLEKRTKMKVRKTDPHFLGASKSCNDCHKKDDPHAFVGKYAKELCSQCHNTKTWKSNIRFDHNKDTKYKLEEAHTKLKCLDCHQTDHKKMRYQWPNLEKSKCLSCHQDFHKDTLNAKWSTGSQCLNCHNQTQWKISQFDHEKVGFKLEGKHAEAKCLDCHKQNKSLIQDGKNHAQWRGLKDTCNSCHKDVHQYGNYVSKTLGALNRCQSCHNSSNWKTRDSFSHNRQTKFHIDGKHLDTKCEGCHIPAQFKFNSTHVLPEFQKEKKSVYHFDKLSSKTCNACHVNPHLGVFSDKRAKMACTECHVTDGWDVKKPDSSFDHANTRFPLRSAHAKLECKDCHLRDNKQVYKFPFKQQGGCVDCHKNVHIGQMSEKFSGRSCTDCHNEDKWELFKLPSLRFDHQMTRFSLTGKHQQTRCEECHKEVKPHYRQFTFEKVDKSFCVECHDNVHDNQFSRKFNNQACSECHDTTNFEKRLSFDHAKTGYTLRGKHFDLKCSECHVPQKELGVFKSGAKKSKFQFPHLDKKDCASCHKDPHKGQFSASCSQCHNEKSWSATVDFHRNFRLSGAHLTLTCNECHIDNRHLAGTSNNCLFCHKKDDVHSGTLPTCSNCHNQNFWDARSFQHSRTRFPLRGVHRTLDCLDCHNRGIYRGTPTDCFSCHQQDAMNATSMNHTPIGNFMDCTSCHKNHFSFGNPK